jgi:TM2 domain-containing membrane protein YozV
MRHDELVYDLGEIAVDTRRPPVEPAERTYRPAQAPPAAGLAANPRLGASLCLFVPGLGQLLSGDISWGLLFLSCFVFCLAVLRAIALTCDRLVQTLPLIGIAPQRIAVSAAVLFVAAATAHVASVLRAALCGDGLRGNEGAHPVAAGLASALVPGWGQVLNGHRVRAAAFLGAAWAVGGTWLAVSPLAETTLSSLGGGRLEGLRGPAGAVALVSATAVVWILAVYDGVAGAMAERRRAR